MLRRRLQMAGNGGGSLLPPELQACEWLENDGNSYIKINNINGSLFGDIDTQYIGYDPFGYRSASSGGSFFQIYANGSGNLILRWFNYSSNNLNMGVNVTDIVRLQLYPNTYPRKYVVNGNEYTTNVGASYFTKDFTLFAMNNNGNISYNNNSRLYYFKSNILQLYACYIKSEQTYTDNKGNVCSAGTPGMYEIVNNVFYTNDGTGNFTHGADINI